MDKNLIWKDLSNLYQISKTLRFELKPIGKTLENINKIGLIEEDNQRNKDFQKIKIIMDEYYKKFIENSINNIQIDLGSLNKYKEVYLEIKKNKNKDNLKKDFIKIQKDLRRELSEKISKIEDFKDFFKKEFIQKVLPKYLEKENKFEDLELVNKFKNWNSYFSGFYENRKNIFSIKEIPTSIYYRIINDNLPKFIDDCEKIKELNNYKKEGFSFKEVEINFKNELNHNSIETFFNLKNFNLILNQKGIDKINLVIGGNSFKDGTKLKGINELINIYSQQIKDASKSKKIRKLKLVPLFKQILSDRESNSFIFETINSEINLIKKIDEFYLDLDFLKFEDKLIKLFKDLKDYNLAEIYIKNDKIISDISQKLFKDYQILKSALFDYAKNNLKLNTEKKLENWFKKTKYFSIYELEKALKEYNLESRFDNDLYDKYLNEINNKEHPICSYFLKYDLFEAKLEEIANLYQKFKEIKKKEFKKTNEEDVRIIKELLDNLKDLFHFIKPIHIDFKNKNKEDKTQIEILKEDSEFYNKFNELFEKLSLIIPLYNKVRNFITKKKFETKKFKLNFQKSTLLNGWDVNKETSNLSIIFKKDNLFYLGIINPKFNNIFKNIENYNLKDNNNFYEKLNYKLLPSPEKMLPKVFFSKKNIDFFNPNTEILKIRNYSTHTKNGNPQEGFEKKEFNLEDCHKMIVFFIESLNQHNEWRNYNFKFKKINEYRDISQFYRDVTEQGYKLSFKKITENYINELVENGKLFLFKIWNKDFSEFSNGNKNLHTLYWEELFSVENLINIKYKLNGQAEIFYRRASIPFKITHYKNKFIDNKDPISNKVESKFDYDLIKDKRYTKDKFLFHCPINLNFKSKNGFYNVSNKVNEIIAKNYDNINILSIDRGERHLAYYTLLDSKGDIIEQESFNTVSNKIKDTSRKVDYHAKLDKLEGDRDKSRKSWNTIENIKELKEGYLSQIVHKISKIAIEKNAIIVFEDLNFGFKRGRFKIEKQVYQKFEKMLIEKLNYLVFKEVDKNDMGGILNAYQLTPKFESFQKMGKQMGIIYYVPANFTSKICPKTGFINLLYPKYESLIQAKNFLKKFEYIKFNQDENLFEFNFNYSNFIDTMKKNKLLKDNWSIYANGIKLKQFKNKEKNNSWDTIEVKVNKELIKLFENYNIDYKNKNNLIEDIIKTDNKYFLEHLIKYIKYILQLRNSRIDSEEDYILSCVKDKNGNFFDSRKAKEDEPKDADANGAYNIGLKGLMIIDKIRKLKEDEKLDLLIKRDDFVNYVIKRGM